MPLAALRLARISRTEMVVTPIVGASRHVRASAFIDSEPSGVRAPLEGLLDSAGDKAYPIDKQAFTSISLRNSGLWG